MSSEIEALRNLGHGADDTDASNFLGLTATLEGDLGQATAIRHTVCHVPPQARILGTGTAGQPMRSPA